MYGEELIGEWGAPPEGGTIPINQSQFIAQIRENCKLDLPLLKREPEHDKIMVMVCGGPSAKMHLEEIREKSKDDKYVIFTSNKTHDWLIKNNIIPNYQFMIDPKESKIKDVKKPHKDVKYLIGISAHPGVFKALEGYDVTRVVALSGALHDGVTDFDIIKALFNSNDYVPLEGGTMAGLRAMTLGNVLGYRTVEFYGFDSCFFSTHKDGKPIYYSYHKDRGENILECKCDDGKIYKSTPVFASQARQFLKWKERLSWIKFIIHGDSLTHHIDMLDDISKKPKHNLVITDYMRKMNKRMFDKLAKGGEEVVYEFGNTGHEYAGKISILAGQLAKEYGSTTLLDYGCGQGTLKNVMPNIVDLEIKEYDPCIDEKSADPKPADVVVCTDVLEHIEPECLENVLDHLQRLTKKVLFVAICLTPAAKQYPDGRNCHLSQLDVDVWFSKLRKRFIITEGRQYKNDRGHDMYLCICQAREVK